MRNKNCLAIALVMLGLVLPSLSWAWGWKSAQTPDDVLNFLNSSAGYQTRIADARISASEIGGVTEFTVFYESASPPAKTGGWGWKKANDPDDVLRFLSGTGNYVHPVKDAQVAAVWKQNHYEFIVFYRRPAQGENVFAGWRWKLATDISDALNFLNGNQAYRHPVTTARIAALKKDNRIEYFIFYQKATEGDPISNWTSKLTRTADNTMNFVSAVKGFQLGWQVEGTEARFLVFANQGTSFWLQSPLENERFIQGEPVRFHALVTSDAVLDGNALSWSSSLDGSLGQGADLTKGNLAKGSRTVTVTGYGTKATTSFRMFADLGEFYTAAPSSAEIARIDKDFSFHWIDGNGPGENWGSYVPVFNQQSTDPSKLVIYAKLDVLRHQNFSEPLPFTNGKTIYEDFKTVSKNLYLTLNCNSNSGGGGTITLNRSLSVWDGRYAGTKDNPDACKSPMPNSSGLYPYVKPLYLLIHEERHNESGDPGHISVPAGSPSAVQMDPRLEGGSGHAWAALYTMWVYKYGKYDPPAIKNDAKDIARGLLGERFPSRPTHSNPKVQAIIDELLQPQ